MADETTTRRVRPAAVKAEIAWVLAGQYVQEDEEFTPNYVLFGERKISRVNIMAIVVANELESNGSILLDDGTGKIAVRGVYQNDTLKEINVGDAVNIIGRPREYGQERYLVAEIVRKVAEGWLRVRKLELEQEQPGPSMAQEQKGETIVEDRVTEESTAPNGSLSNPERIINYIKEHDDGNGIGVEEIVSSTGIENCEELIENMLKEGELFENMPGKLKILE